MKRLAIVLALAAAGCEIVGADAPPRTPNIVDMAAPVSCVPADMPKPPGAVPTASELKAAPGHAERYQQLAEFYAVFSPWIPAAVGVIEACRQAGGKP